MDAEETKWMWPEELEKAKKQIMAMDTYFTKAVELAISSVHPGAALVHPGRRSGQPHERAEGTPERRGGQPHRLSRRLPLRPALPDGRGAVPAVPARAPGGVAGPLRGVSWGGKKGIKSGEHMRYLRSL